MLITIDGKECSCEKGEFLLDIARRNGIFIPTLCRHEGLPGQGTCRMCIVEVETDGRKQVITSCIYPVEKECTVYTNSDKIKQQRRVLLSLLQSRAPESAGELKSLCGVDNEAPERFIKLEGESCILCGLCAKACEALGTGALATVNRGADKEVGTPYGEPPVDCVGCASCASVCPVNAIEVKENGESRTIWGRTFALTRCECCGEVIGTKEEFLHSAERLGEALDAKCAKCKRKTTADVLADTYGITIKQV